MVYNGGNMTRIKIMLWAALFTVMLVSCIDFLEGPDDDPLPPLKENEFYAQNIKTGKFYIVKAKKMVEGEKCVIWAEEGSGITENKAQEIADEYDNKIRPTVVNTFSEKDFIFRSKTYNDMLDFANWIVGKNNKKLTVLLLDIKDDYNPPKINSYVAGYFFSGNFLQAGKQNGGQYYSNGLDMIYIDTKPGLETETNEKQTYMTFAHELQHLVNFVTTVQTQRKDIMDTWIDEGLSSQAEYLYLGVNPPTRYQWFINDDKKTIAKGNNFFVWGNHSEVSDAILDDYATVYLFFRWLSLQASQKSLSDIFLKIETSNYSDYRAVTDVAKQIDSTWVNWEPLLRTWLAANYYPKNSYGYTGDTQLQNNIKVNPIGGKTILLYPGEGVYSKIKIDDSAGSFLPAGLSGNSIRYAGLTETNNTISSSSPYTGKVLLTFNANTSNTGWLETGNLTGVSSSISPTMARNIQTETISGPYVIDARDMLERSRR